MPIKVEGNGNEVRDGHGTLKAMLAKDESKGKQRRSQLTKKLGQGYREVEIRPTSSNWNNQGRVGGNQTDRHQQAV